MCIWIKPSFSFKDIFNNTKMIIWLFNIVYCQLWDFASILMTFTFHSDRVLVLDTIVGNPEHGIVHHVMIWNQMLFHRFVGLIAAFEHRILVVFTAIVNAEFTWCMAREEVCSRPMEWIRILVISAKKVELAIGTLFCRVILIPWINGNNHFRCKWFIKFSCLDMIKFYYFIMTKCLRDVNWFRDSLALLFLWPSNTWTVISEKVIS